MRAARMRSERGEPERPTPFGAFGWAWILATGPTPAQSIGTVVLRFLGESHIDVPMLRDGAADLELGIIDSREPEIRTQELFTEHGVAVVREGHPLTTGTLTARRY